MHLMKQHENCHLFFSLTPELEMSENRITPITAAPIKRVSVPAPSSPRKNKAAEINEQNATTITIGVNMVLALSLLFK